MAEQLTGVFRQSDQVVARQVVDQWLLIPLHGTAADLQKVYLLNDTSAAIWRLLAQPITFEQLVRALQAEYAAPEDTLRREAGEFVLDLVQRGFVTHEARDE